MRIVIDLQACQNAGSRFRGIGRYSRSLAQAMVREGRGHDYWIALNAELADAVEDIRACFDGLVPQEQIVLWDRPFAWSAHLPGDPWRGRVAEMLREDFLAWLKPDFVHLASLFEGWGDAATTSIGRGSAATPRTAVTLYDLIPMTMSELYLPDPRSRAWYARKLQDLRRADLCLAISDYTREEAVRLLQLPDERVVNISGSTDPLFRRLPAQPGRAAALAQRLGIIRPFVMYTGGFDPRKNVAGLVRAYAQLPADVRGPRQLVVVGMPPADVLASLRSLVADCGLGEDDVRFVGFLPDPDLVRLYNDCELYVFPSRYEGFGLPALEAMACGAPVIGADASSLPEVIGYPEAMFDAGRDEAMSEKMREALTDAGLRARLLEHGEERVRRFSWERSARVALDAIEAAAARPPRPPRSAVGDGDGTPADPTAARWDFLARQSQGLTGLVQGRDLDADTLRRLAAAQSANHPLPQRRRQLLVDVSNLSERDAHTGIQRVVRNILRELPGVVPADVVVEPVRFDGSVLRYARAFMHRLLGADGPAPEDDLLDATGADVFLGLDLSAHIVPHHYEVFDALRRRGVAIHFVVYDLIPWLRADSVNPDSLQLLWAWYRSIGTLADGLCCISAAVAAELVDWCDEVRPARMRPLSIGHFHLGAELDADLAGPADPPLPPSTRRRFLMVGTIEPRKGHAQALAAFDLLWAEGRDVELVIAGRPGWLTDAVQAELRQHPERGRRLHWLESLDDAGLVALYAQCDALLAASEAEGFGLPLAEAAAHGLPVIARDLPVFVEVAGGHAHYFSGYAADDLAQGVRGWLALAEHGGVPASTAMPRLGWRQSAQGLVDLVLGQRWTYRWSAGPRYLFPAHDQRWFRQVGHIERHDLVADGQPGFLTYGPYVAVPAGRYRLRVLGRWDGDTGEPALLEVIAGQGHLHALDATLHPGMQAAEGVLLDTGIELATDVTDLELRLLVHSNHRLRLRGFEMRREGDADDDPSA